MAAPAIVWRNTKVVQRRRLWNQARCNGTSRLYIVVQSRPDDSEWEGLPNLEVLEGGASARTNSGANRTTPSRA